MNSDYLIAKINRLESRIESSKGSPAKLPFRVGGNLLLVLFMMISNFWALIRWPIAAASRLSNSGAVDRPEGRPVDVDSEKLNEILATENKVLVDFWAEWCGPCVMMNGSIQKLSKETADSYIIAKVNTVTNPKVAKKYGVKGLPTLILFENGQEIDRYAGALSYVELKEFIQN